MQGRVAMGGKLKPMRILTQTVIQRFLRCRFVIGAHTIPTSMARCRVMPTQARLIAGLSRMPYFAAISRGMWEFVLMLILEHLHVVERFALDLLARLKVVAGTHSVL